MPKGPKGQKRPASVVGCAVTVAKIATGENEDAEYVAPGRKKSGEAGAAARGKSLSAARRQEIAKIAARGRWGKEVPMTEKQRLLNTLFETKGQEHLNIKFCRGLSDDTSPEDLCQQANAAIFQVESGLVEPLLGFGDKERKVVEVKDLFAKD